MTTLAAIDTLLMIRAAVPLSEPQRRGVDAALRRGLAWIQSHWTLRTPPPAEAGWTPQKAEYLYLLMRVLTALGVKTVSGSEWFLEGSYVLLRSQYADGSWDSGGRAALLDTCSAMLFLARGALRLPPREK